MRDRNTKVFVSYTLRDGNINPHVLQSLQRNLSEVCCPYVHALHEQSRGWHEQVRVVRELMTSHMLIVIESPLVHESPWVRLELVLSKLKLMPVIRLSVEDVVALTLEVG